MMYIFGYELLLTLDKCDVTRFTRKNIEEYLKDLCNWIEMEREDLHFWDYENEEIPVEEQHLKGVSAVQFIKTSNITIHTLEMSRRVYLNIFSCKWFDQETAINRSLLAFDGTVKFSLFIMRE